MSLPCPVLTTLAAFCTSLALTTHPVTAAALPQTQASQTQASQTQAFQAPTTQVPTAALPSDTTDWLSEVNTYRTAAGLPPVVDDPPAPQAFSPTSPT